MSKKIPIRKFSFRIIVFSVIIAALSLLFQWLWPNLATPAMPFIVLFFFAMTLFTMYIVLRSDDLNAVNTADDPERIKPETIPVGDRAVLPPKSWNVLRYTFA